MGNGQLFHTFINDLCGFMVGMVETTAAHFSYPDGSLRLLSQCLGFCLYFINYKQIIAFSFQLLTRLFSALLLWLYKAEG